MGRRIGQNLEIVGELGRGGMGEVYVAHDRRLDRRVALKSIRAERRMSAYAKERFLREARVLSSLDHPNICRIYDYVETDDRDYLVLELIEGQTLHRTIRDGPSQAVRLDIAQQLAGVLVVAHAAGVVHRDLKPDNVMVTPSGQIKVLDFGLARQLDETEQPPDEPPADAADGGAHPTLALSDLETRIEAADRRTRLGQIVGTPTFMSPEQAEGAELTAASDMYSFGLVLQMLFTGEWPYDEGLRLSELMERVRGAKTRAVTGIDRDLAALIRRLKSLAPADRPTAVQAAERLRWIVDKPRRRLRRGIAAALVAAAVLVAVKYTVDLRRERSHAVQARNDAEDLLTFMIGDLRDRLAPVGRLDVLDAVGDKALEYFARLPEQQLDEVDLFRRTNALRLIGQVRTAEGDVPAARQAFEESLTLARNLVARDPTRGEWLAGLGASVFYLGSIAFDRGEIDAAAESFHEYYDIARRLIALDPSNPEWQMELAYAHTNLGALHRARGEIEQALAEFDRSVQIKRELTRARPDDVERRRDLANSLSWLADARAQEDDVAGALGLYREELEVRTRLTEQDPDNTEARFLLSTCHSHLGELEQAADRPREALEHFRAMRRLARELVSIDPENANWQRELVVSHRLLAGAWHELGDAEAARRELEAGLEVLRGLAQRDPDNDEWSHQRARFRHELRRLASARGA